MRPNLYEKRKKKDIQPRNQCEEMIMIGINDRKKKKKYMKVINIRLKGE
jgi:hypothetical protein